MQTLIRDTAMLHQAFPGLHAQLAQLRPTLIDVPAPACLVAAPAAEFLGQRRKP
jgi:hypothetical protein